MHQINGNFLANNISKLSVLIMASIVLIMVTNCSDNPPPETSRRATLNLFPWAGGDCAWNPNNRNFTLRVTIHKDGGIWKEAQEFDGNEFN